MYGGATVAAWYPITPSTSVVDAFEKYASRLRIDPGTGKQNFAIVQAEDELAAMGMVIGASWNGARSFTATSGPGVSLMSEFLGLAYFAEIPAVLIDVQRTGPSTGITLAATTQSALNTKLFADVFDFTPPAQKVKAIDTSNHGTSGGMTYIFSKLKDNGELKITCGFNVDVDLQTYLGVADTWTLTFPKSPSTASTAATVAFSGAIIEQTPKAPFEDKMTADIVIKVSGNITVTPQA